MGNQRVAAQSRVSLGNIYVEQGQYSEALKQMLSAEPVLKAANDVFSLGKLYNNMTQAYAGLEQGAQVVKYAEMGIAQNQLIGNAQSEALGRVYLGLGYLKGSIRRPLRRVIKPWYMDRIMRHLTFSWGR